MKSHCIYGSDDCTRCKQCQLESNDGVCDKKDCVGYFYKRMQKGYKPDDSCVVSAIEGLRRATFTQDIYILLSEFLSDEEFLMDSSPDLRGFTRWLKINQPNG